MSSLVEQGANIGSGFLISMIVWQIIGPLYGYHVTLHDNFGITAIFTVVSLTRGYLWRRYFNSRVIRAISTNQDSRG